MMLKPPLPTVILKRARDMRRESTDAGSRLCQHLRGGRVEGLKFRRQHPIPSHVADLGCIGKKLTVELDGSQHSPGVDTARTAYLESQEYRVLRFWNNDVLLETDSVLDAIWKAAHAPDPLPDASPGRRGAKRHDRERFRARYDLELGTILNVAHATDLHPNPSPGGRGA